ncbi:hypothetical protein L0128_07710 [candidate division KSB1 bacterium]|nr:hypothetical protein [candidate division KSB1 bacterium]
MDATKTIYQSLPETFLIPKAFVHKKGEIIILIDDESTSPKPRFLKEFFGILPDFPERSHQGEYEPRELL